jgi:hypothetical protein
MGKKYNEVSCYLYMKPWVQTPYHQKKKKKIIIRQKYRHKNYLYCCLPTNQVKVNANWWD